MKKIFPFTLLLIAMLLVAACGGDEKSTSDNSAKDSPKETQTDTTSTNDDVDMEDDQSNDADDSASDDSSDEEAADDQDIPDDISVPQENTAAPTTPYAGKIGTELFRQEVLPRFVSKKLLADDDLAWGCAEESYAPLEIKTSDYAYNCYVEYLPRSSTQKFVLTFKSDGNYTTQALGDSIKDAGY